MRVGTHQRVGKGNGPILALPCGHNAGEIFQIDLVHYASTGGDHPEVLERSLGPSQQDIAFTVPFELPLHVESKGLAGARVVHLNRVVDNQVGRNQGVYPLGVATHAVNRRPHRCQVDHPGHSGEVLQQNTRRHKRYLTSRWALRAPAGDGEHVLLIHQAAIVVSQHVLQKDPDGKG